MPSCNTYRFTWVSLTLVVGYLLTASPPDLECGIAHLGPPGPAQPFSLDMGLLLLAMVPDFMRGVARLGRQHWLLLTFTAD